jgi:Histidine kinase-, DNA gyrase B-, and HSP90-like ATPase.
MAQFKTRARALDMLGRQQIAGIPTAISELFKNAHDAYADNVEVDYYRSDGLFVLRDDGLGMTKEDFEQRWLTLGTDSQIGSKKGLTPPPKDPNKSPRPILGEKGIGRLAIASIGSQVLVLTRAKREDKLHDLVVAYIHWGIFELPGLDLDEIIIPLETFTGGTLPNRDFLSSMVNEVIDNIRELESKGKLEYEDAQKLITDVQQFDLNPSEIDSYVENMTLSENGHGTHFLIFPADDLLQLSIDGYSNTGKASPLLKMLLGFTNTMVPDAAPPAIHVRFRDHKTDEYFVDIISEQEFFTPKEFEMADHHIQGEFDDYGQFKGTITIYGEDEIEHIVPWQGAQGKNTLCGPFKINVAYAQGNLSQSTIAPEDFNSLIAKLDLYGGLYIYKNGIRILPYGDSDYDFLDIERNRTKSAAYYYFSYRRMFGVIDITKEKNPQLIEKAGREGFRENKAYKQFREILKNLFNQLAADFFREASSNPKTEFFLKRREELARLHKAKQLHEKKSKFKKKQFAEKLNEFFLKSKENVPQKEIEELLENMELGFQIASSMDDPEKSSMEFLDVESRARKDLNAIRDKYKVTKPRGLALSKNVLFDFEAYLEEYELLEDNIFLTAEKKIDALSNIAATNFKIEIDRRRRLERAINDIFEETKKATNSKTSETKSKLKSVNNNITKLIHEILVDMDNEINFSTSEVAKIDVSNMSDSDLVSKRLEIESTILSKVERDKEILDNIKTQLENINWTKNEDGEIVTSVDVNEAIEEELLTLRERSDIDLQLTQLGTAVGIIHHEFESTIKLIRTNIKRLKAWADVNEDLDPIYRNIRSSFEHLDGYLTLFTPLNRRLYRTEVDIKGNTVKDYIDDIFSERFKRHEISIEFTSKFKAKIIQGYPSTFYPVFVNIIDNSIFWLKEHPHDKKIILDADSNGFIISNTGPEIPVRDRGIIFEQGFSRKPMGRGLGLYVSKQVLSKVGWDIHVVNPQPNVSVTFRIDDLGMKDN